MEGGQADISIAAGDLPLSSVHSGLGVNVSGPQIQLAGKHCEGRCAVIPVGSAVHFPKWFHWERPLGLETCCWFTLNFKVRMSHYFLIVIKLDIKKNETLWDL